MKNRSLHTIASALVLLVGPFSPVVPTTADHMCGPENETGGEETASNDNTLSCLKAAVRDVLGTMERSLRIKMTGPERVWISDVYDITFFLANQDPVPHIVAVEVLPKTGNVCSVASYGTSSGATKTVRPNEYILEANGTLAVLGLFGGDSVTGGVRVKPAAGGNCEVEVRVTLDLLLHQSATLTTFVAIPPRYADLGNVVVTASDCVGAESMQGVSPTGLTVAADEPIDVTAALDYAEPCSDDDASGSVAIQRQLSNGDWETLGGATMSSPGHQDFRARGTITLAEGTHQFRLLASASTGFKISWWCVLSVMSAIGGLKAFGIAGTTALELFLGVGLSNPAGVVALSLIAVAAILITIGLTCFGMSDVIEIPFTVTAQSAQPPAALRTVAALMEDRAGTLQL